MQHSSDKLRRYKGKASDHPCVGLMLVDLPEGLPVPGVSVPASSIPVWNQDSKEWLQPIFDFADQHLQDDGAIIFFHPFRLSTKSTILGYCKTYGFQIEKEWWGMNRLHLTSPANPSSTVSLLIYFLLFSIFKFMFSFHIGVH